MKTYITNKVLTVQFVPFDQFRLGYCEFRPTKQKKKKKNETNFPYSLIEEGDLNTSFTFS